VVPAPAAAVGLALAFDLLVAEVPRSVHPVALFGRGVAPLDRSWGYPRAVGVIVAAVLPIGAAAIAGTAVVVALRAGTAAGTAVAGGVLFTTTSLRMLLSVAADVIEASEPDPEGARSMARALVGRSTEDLSPGHLRSAAVESAAENLADGLVGPLAAFALGAQFSLAAGAAAAAWLKAVNTLDSMLGYRSKPVGWASARLDDVAMWLPARLSATLLAAAARSPRALLRARPGVKAVSSPNSGWPMATLAVALGVRLEKPGAYSLNPGASLPSVASARRGVRVVGVAGLLAFLGAGVVSWS